MLDHTDNISLNKIAFNDKNVERRFWFFFVLLSYFFCNTFEFLSVAFVGIQLAKTCDESTVWVEILCSAKGCILPSPNFEQNSFCKKLHFLTSGWTERFRQSLLDIWVVECWNIPTHAWQNLLFSSTLSITLWCHVKKLIILSLFKVYTLNLYTLRKKTVPSICSLLITRL